MNVDAETAIVPGTEVYLDVVERNGKLVFDAQFVYYDAHLHQFDIKEAGNSSDDIDSWDLYNDDVPFFNSVRIFHLPYGQDIGFKEGDRVRAVVKSAYVSWRKTKDERRKIHVTVSNARRVYHWRRERERLYDSHLLVITLRCGVRKIKEKVIPLTIKKGVQSDDGRVTPIIVEVLPGRNGPILAASRDYRRSVMTTSDYRLDQKQRGRTVQDIEKDFLRVPSFDRIIPTRERPRVRHAHA